MISGDHKKLSQLNKLSSEPAIRSYDSGQWIPSFDSYHLTAIWIVLNTLDSYNPGKSPWDSEVVFVIFSHFWMSS